MSPKLFPVFYNTATDNVQDAEKLDVGHARIWPRSCSSGTFPCGLPPHLPACLHVHSLQMHNPQVWFYSMHEYFLMLTALNRSPHTSKPPLHCAFRLQTMYVAEWTEAGGWQGEMRPYGPLPLEPSAQVM